MDPITGAVASAGIKAAGQAVGGLVKFGASLFGGGKRRREQRRAAKELAQEKAKFEQLDTSNPYKNITNPYENLTVNTQAADFAAQQAAQGGRGRRVGRGPVQPAVRHGAHQLRLPDGEDG